MDEVAAQERGAKTVTTKELAETLGVAQNTVLNAARQLFDQSQVLAIGGTHGGKAQMRFDEAQATAIKQEVQRHHNLATRQVDKVSTRLENIEAIAQAADNMDDETLYKSALGLMHKALRRADARLAEKDAQLKAAQPKVDFYDTVVESADAVDMKQAAKLLRLGMGRTKLFAFLRERHVLMDDNEPYQEYVDKGCFRVVEAKFNLPDGTIKTSRKTVVLQKGLDFIKRLAKKEAA